MSGYWYFDEIICSDFIDDWVQIALPAKAKVKAEYGNLPFEEQCEICAQVNN